MTERLPNLNAPVVDIKTGRLKPPWNSFFQQFAQAPPEVVGIDVTGSPFQITANNNGTLIISGGTVSLIQLIRGEATITVATSTTGPRIIPIKINDTVVVTYSVVPTIQFLPD